MAQNDFLNIRDTLSKFQEENTKDYVKAIVSLETGIDDEAQLELMYQNWMADKNAPLITQEWLEDYQVELSQEKFEAEIAEAFVEAADYAYYFLDQEELKEDEAAQNKIHQWFDNEADKLVFDDRFEIVRDNDRYILENKNVDYHDQEAVINYFKQKHVFEDVLSRSQIAEELHNFTAIRDHLHRAFEQEKSKALTPEKGRTR